MKTTLALALLPIFAVLVILWVGGGVLFVQPASPIQSQVVSQNDAIREDSDWGVFHTYYQGETHGTQDVLAGVAEIKPGQQIHPPHQHEEEEYLLVTEGQGEWHLNGKTFAAAKGDMLYAAPWDIHGIRNTGASPLSFVVWKWNNKGVTAPPPPPGGNGR